MAHNKYRHGLIGCLLMLIMSQSCANGAHILLCNDTFGEDFRLTLTNNFDESSTKFDGFLTLDCTSISNSNKNLENEEQLQHNIVKRSFTKPSNTSIQNEIKKIKDEMEKIKSLVVVTNEDRERLNTLETLMESLNRMLDDLNKQFEEKRTELESNVGNLVNEVELLKNKTGEEKEAYLINECVAALNRRNFEYCEEKLEELRHYKIPIVIKKVYKKNAQNFDVIFQFGKSLFNTRRSFLVFESLFNEMREFKQENVFKAINLIKVVNEKVIKQQHTEIKVKSDARALMTDLRNYVKSIAKKEIIYSINESELTADAVKILEEIYKEDNILYVDTLADVIKDIYKEAKQRTIWRLVYLTQKYSKLNRACIILYNKLKVEDGLSSENMLDFGLWVILLENSLKQIGKSYEIQQMMNELRTELSASVKNVLFSKKVCIKNVHYDEYLYVSDEAVSLASGSHNVYTSKSPSLPTKYWEINVKENNLSIQNVKYKISLYPSDESNRKRYVLSSYAYFLRITDVFWKIIPYNDGAYIKSVKYNEYLCMDGENLSSGKRRVFTSKNKNDYCEWKFENCD